MLNVDIKSDRGGNEMIEFHATTICAVRRGPDDICIGGDGQVTMGETYNYEKRRKESKKDLQKYGSDRLCGFGGGCVRTYRQI